MGIAWTGDASEVSPQKRKKTKTLAEGQSAGLASHQGDRVGPEILNEVVVDSSSETISVDTSSDNELAKEKDASHAPKDPVEKRPMPKDQWYGRTWALLSWAAL